MAHQGIDLIESGELRVPYAINLYCVFFPSSCSRQASSTFPSPTASSPTKKLCTTWQNVQWFLRRAARPMLTAATAVPARLVAPRRAPVRRQAAATARLTHGARQVPEQRKSRSTLIRWLRKTTRRRAAIFAHSLRIVLLQNRPFSICLPFLFDGSVKGTGLGRCFAVVCIRVFAFQIGCRARHSEHTTCIVFFFCGRTCLVLALFEVCPYPTSFWGFKCGQVSLLVFCFWAVIFFVCVMSFFDHFNTELFSR